MVSCSGISRGSFRPAAVAVVAASLAVSLAVGSAPGAGAAQPRSAAVGAAIVPAAWSSTGPGPVHVTGVGWHPTQSGTVYAGTSNGVMLRSADAGATWSRLAAVSDDQIIDVAVRGNVVLAALQSLSGGVGGVARSLDGGATWQLAGPAQGITESYSYAIDIDPNNPDTALLATNHGLFRSTNAGASWGKVGVPTEIAPLDAQVYDVLFDPAAPGRAFIASNKGVSRSTDSGFSFTAFNTGGVDSSGRLAISGGIVYASFFNTVMRRTTTGVDTWQSAATGLPSDYPSRVAVAGNTLLVSVGSTLYRSAASPVSWAPAPVQPPFYLSTAAVDPTQSGRILGLNLGDGRLARTLDAGASWQAVDVGVPGAMTSVVVPTAAGSALVLAESGLVRTDDHGQTFAGSATGLVASPALDRSGPAVATGDPTRAAVFGTSSDFAVSADGGRTWSTRNYGIANYDGALAYAPSDPNRVYGAGFVGAVGAFRRSTTGGDSWSSAGAPVFNFANGLAVDVGDPLLVYLATSEGLLVSGNAGDTWAPGGGLPAGSSGPVVADPVTTGTAYLVAAGKVWRSVDRGVSWGALPVLPAGSPSDVVVDPAAPTTLWVATEVGVFRSTDGGAAWESYSSGLPSLRVRDLALDRDGTVLYAATDRGLAVTSLVEPATPGTGTPPPPTGGSALARPSKPRKVTASSRRGRVVVRWRAPRAGAPLAGYTVQAKAKSKKARYRVASARVRPGATRYVWKKAKPGRTYLVRVAARNAVGRGPFSKPARVRVRR